MVLRRTRRMLGAVAVGVLLVPAAARAQEGGIEGVGTIDDGVYSGSMGISGRISHSIDQGSINWIGSFQGPAQLVIENGVASGEFAMAGPASVTGHWAGGISINGSQSVTATGNFGGSGGAYTVSGSVTTTGSVTANTPAGSFTQPVNDTTSGSNGTIDRLLFTCDHLYGEFSYPVEQELNSNGFSFDADGFLVLLREPYTSDVKDQLEDLYLAVESAQARLDPAMLQSDEEATAIADLEVLLAQSIQLAAQLADSPCPPDARYLELAGGMILTITGTLMQRALEHFVAAEPGSPEWTQSMIDMYALTVVLSGTGAASEPFGQELLEISHDFFEDVLNAALDELNDLADARDDDEWPPFHELEPWVQDAIAVPLAVGSTMDWTYVYEGDGQVVDAAEVVEEIHRNA